MMLSATKPRLSTLLQGLVTLPAGFDRELRGIELDSRKVGPGTLFLACKGLRQDARDFVADAVSQGASAVVVEADGNAAAPSQLGNVPVIPLAGLPGLMHVLAARFYAEPAAQMRMMGITGTNGKTTCCQLLAKVLTALGHSCGVIGTLGYGRVGQSLSVDLDGPGTTPDAVQLQRILAELREQDVDTVVMELSSHALQQKRVDVDTFALGMFTNLSRDHLDYHGSMAAYGACKRELFRGQHLQVAILNLDDSYSADTRALLPAAAACRTWSLHKPEADLYATSLHCNHEGLQLAVAGRWGEFVIRSRLLGSFNAANLLAVLCATFALQSAQADFDPAAVIAAIEELTPVPGRMQRIGAGPVEAVVDYAHTPDALEKALLAAREHTTGRVYCVFGCGGNRDTGKRSLMGEVAARLADVIVLTDDNPRNEDGDAIISAIRAGIGAHPAVSVIRDRATAIKTAIARAEPGDMVLVAGKGHESWQEVGEQRLPFSDAQQAANSLSQVAEVVR